ncbi:hypothetical protein ACHAWF_004751 [Thalassiosira exigua]
MASAGEDCPPSEAGPTDKKAAPTDGSSEATPLGDDVAGSAPASDQSDAAPTAASEPSPSQASPSQASPSPHAQPQPSAKKKRRSDVQLTKDDRSEGRDGEADDGDLNDEGGKRSDPFERASDEVLKKRRIVKASQGKWSAAAGGNGSANGGGGGTFASVTLRPSGEGGEKSPSTSSGDAAPAVFGSRAQVPTFGSAAAAGGGPGFGSAATKAGEFGSGFGSASSGFGALKPSPDKDTAGDGKGDADDKGDADSSPPKASAFGGGFGAPSSGFGALNSTKSSFGFGSTSDDKGAVGSGSAFGSKGGGFGSASGDKDTAAASTGSEFGGTFAKSPEPAPSTPSKFPTSSVVDTANGEQNEDCLCQVRAKLFKMVPEEKNPAADEEGSPPKGDVLSVAPTSGRMELVKAKKEDGASPEKGGESAGSQTAGVDGAQNPRMVQKEAGIGPVRVLKQKSPLAIVEEGADEDRNPPLARVVQRQETSGGQATKVILNVRLDPETCNLIRRGEKFVQLNVPNGAGALESSLFKVKTTADADTLEKNLKAMLGASGSTTE